MLVFAEQRIEQLTPREREVLEHLVVGCSSKVVARELSISPRTVEVHRPREKEVFDHIVAGGSNKEIARTLDISPRTVEAHRARVMEKMEAENLSHLVLMACAIEA